MDMQVTLTLPDDIYQRARRMAELTGHSVNEVLSQMLGRSLPPLVSEFDSPPITEISDAAIHALAIAYYRLS